MGEQCPSYLSDFVDALKPLSLGTMSGFDTSRPAAALEVGNALALAKKIMGANRTI